MSGLFKTTAMLMVFSLIFGCAATQQVSRETIIDNNAELAQLAGALANAEGQGVNYLAPENFRRASENFEKAIAAATSDNSNKASIFAGAGLENLGAAVVDAEESRRVLWEVLDARERAQAADVPSLFPEEYIRLEKDLVVATALVEKGKAEKAKNRRPALITGYRELELASLKKDVVAKAVSALWNAREMGAHKQAPKTIRQAEEEIKLAQSILDAGKSRTDEAQEHARLAQSLANRSIHVADVIRLFERRKFKREDIVLWYQDQLSRLNEAFSTDLPFTEENRKLIINLRNRIITVITERDAANSRNAELEEELAALRLAHEEEIRGLLEDSEARADKLQQRLAENERVAAESEARYQAIQDMFSNAEAEVFRQGRDVKLVTYGFDFTAGQSEIASANFDLLFKIVSAINIFETPRIVVSGHTDSQGSEQYNLELSQRRADTVADFLKKIGQFDPKRVVATGYGEARPVANNETTQGRTLNRRIEILIINK